MTTSSPKPSKWSIIISVASLIITLATGGYAIQSNRRAEKLFGSQMRPLIQLRPTAIAFNPLKDSTITQFEIMNYSGFDAFDVNYDFKYGNNDWIVQWLRAEIHRLEQLTQPTPEEDKRLNFFSTMPSGFPRIKHGEMKRGGIAGSLTLDDVCNNREGIEMLIRINWKNEKGWLFERIRKFTLVCTLIQR